MKTPKTPNLKGIKHIRIVEWHNDYSQDSEVTEAISLGWQLLLIQPGQFHSSFVLGWGSGEPPQTAHQKRRAEFAEAVKRKVR